MKFINLIESFAHEFVPLVLRYDKEDPKEITSLVKNQCSQNFIQLQNPDIVRKRFQRLNIKFAHNLVAQNFTEKCEINQHTKSYTLDMLKKEDPASDR